MLPAFSSLPSPYKPERIVWVTGKKKEGVGGWGAAVETIYNSAGI
jgi:hypothetical protein